MGCGQSKPIPPPTTTENQETGNNVAAEETSPNFEVEIVQGTSASNQTTEDKVEPNDESREEDENLEGAELISKGEEAPQSWLVVTEEQSAVLNINVDVDLPDKAIDPLLQSITSHISRKSEKKPEEVVQQIADFKIGEIDTLDSAKRFKLLFLKDDAEKLKVRAELLKEELAKLHEDNEYRILRVLGHNNSEAIFHALNELHSRKKRCKSAMMGFLSDMHDIPASSRPEDIEHNDIPESDQPSNNLLMVVIDQGDLTEALSIEIEGRHEDAPLKSEQQDSAVESADGLISPQNSRVSAIEPDQACITANDETLVAKLLENQAVMEEQKLLQDQSDNVAPENLASQPLPVESSTDSKTFVKESAKITPVEQQEQAIQSPRTPAPPPPSQADSVQAKDDWNIENKHPEDHEEIHETAEAAAPPIAVKVSKKGHHGTAVEQIKNEASKERPGSGKHGKKEKRADSPKSRPVSRTSSIASQPKKVADARPAAAKVSRAKKK